MLVSVNFGDDMNRVMLDLETMGNGTNAAIIAIGAARFDAEKITDEFYTVIDLASSISAGLEMDASTVLWWMKQSDDARKQFERDGVQLNDALKQFADWIGADAEVWGNGAAFDNAILSNAYRKCGIEQPWKFWNNRCYQTVKNLHQDVEMKRMGVYHRAVDDAKSQADHLMRIISR